MGRQIHIYMQPDDCKAFLHFVQERDPVVVIPFTSKAPELQEVREPWVSGGWFCLWNQALQPSLRYDYISESKIGPYYRVDDSLPILEFSMSVPGEWNDRPALFQGRIYTGLTTRKGAEFDRWYNAIVRWIRTNYKRNPDRYIGGYVGPAAYEWFLKGGVLLPMFSPVISPAWLAVIESQDAVRRILRTGEKSKRGQRASPRS